MPYRKTFTPRDYKLSERELAHLAGALSAPPAPPPPLRLSRCQGLIFSAMQAMADARGRLSPTQAQIAKRSGVGAQSIGQHLMVLERKGFIKALRRGSKGEQRSVLYQILVDRPQAARRVPKGPDLAPEQVLPELPALFAAHPDGITAQAVMADYRLGYDHACAVMRWLDAHGHGQWVHRHGRHGTAKILLPPDAPYTEYELSEKQEAVFTAMACMADARGRLSPTQAQIAKRAGVQSGGLSVHLWALQRKGLIKEVSKAVGNGAQPAVYQILRQPTHQSRPAQGRAAGAHPELGRDAGA